MPTTYKCIYRPESALHCFTWMKSFFFSQKIIPNQYLLKGQISIKETIRGCEHSVEQKKPVTLRRLLCDSCLQQQAEVNSVWAAFWAGKVSGQIRKRWYCVSSAEHWLCGYWPRGDSLSSLLRLVALFHHYVVLHDTNRFPNPQPHSAYRPPPPVHYMSVIILYRQVSCNGLFVLDVWWPSFFWSHFAFHHQLGWPSSKRLKSSKRWTRYGETGRVTHCWWECKMVQPRRETV